MRGSAGICSYAKAGCAPPDQTTSVFVEKYQPLGMGDDGQTGVCYGVDLEKLRAFDSCTISNAIERHNIRPRNEGFLSGVARCQFPNLPPMVGYAATARVRTASPPMSHRCYYDRMDWWNYVASLPEPRVLVLHDAADRTFEGRAVN